MRARAWNPWWILLGTALVPATLGVLFLLRTSPLPLHSEAAPIHWLRIQNDVLAFDSMEVAREMSEMLEEAVEDLKTLALLAPTLENAKAFVDVHMSRRPLMSGKRNLVTPSREYNGVGWFDLEGRRRFEWRSHGGERDLKPGEPCRIIELCDQPLLERLKSASPGEVRVGSLLRWYVAQHERAEESHSALWFGLRRADGILVLALDYRHIQEVLYTPTYPYVVKTNLMDAYNQGNYVHILDAQTRFIAHPKIWHVMGLDRKTGEWVAPLQTESEQGQHPIQVSAYQRGLLTNYFSRLLSKSFQQKSVDIFQAPNLRGSTRVVSVAPILFEEAQFKETGVFGYIIAGCHLDSFEAPKEKYFPYY